MVDNKTIVSTRIVKNVILKIGKLQFHVNLVVMTMQQAYSRGYHILLGRLELRDVKVKRDWNRDKISVKKAKKNIEFGEHKDLREKVMTPIYIENCNMTEELEDDEEKSFLK